MRPELKRLILNACARLGGCALSTEEAEENTRRQAIEDFKVLLARKIDLSTRAELFLGGEYVWLETRPTVRFEVDGHSLLLAGGNGECELTEECGGHTMPLARLAVSDPRFEDRLLAALGAALDPVRQ
jgi:hypothetical protein